MRVKMMSTRRVKTLRWYTGLLFAESFRLKVIVSLLVDTARR
jgi:hypothetical protein